MNESECGVKWMNWVNVECDKEDPNCGMNDDRISIDVWLIVMWNDINW